MAVTMFLTVISPLAIAYVAGMSDRMRCSPQTKALLAPLVVIVLFIIGSFFDGTLTWPVPSEFWRNLGTAVTLYGVQQAAYNVGEASKIIPYLEQRQEPIDTSSPPTVNAKPVRRRRVRIYDVD